MPDPVFLLQGHLRKAQGAALGKYGKMIYLPIETAASTGRFQDFPVYNALKEAALRPFRQGDYSSESRLAIPGALQFAEQFCHVVGSSGPFSRIPR